MREPDFQTDGWSIEDGESYHLAAPETFWIPDRERRESLEPGDLAKLIFRISVDDGDENCAGADVGSRQRACRWRVSGYARQ